MKHNTTPTPEEFQEIKIYIEEKTGHTPHSLYETLNFDDLFIDDRALTAFMGLESSYFPPKEWMQISAKKDLLRALASNNTKDILTPPRQKNHKWSRGTWRKWTRNKTTGHKAQAE